MKDGPRPAWHKRIRFFFIDCIDHRATAHIGINNKRYFLYFFVYFAANTKGDVTAMTFVPEDEKIELQEDVEKLIRNGSGAH